MRIDLTTLKLERMQMMDLNEVMAIETSVYSHPWSVGNFVDSLKNGDDAWVVRSVDGTLLGYFVQMQVVDEAHLLTMAVMGLMQNQGIGQFLLNHVVERASSMKLNAVLLEVRVSNLHALAVYEKFGFVPIGRRKNYYEISIHQREDALILRYPLHVKMSS